MISRRRAHTPGVVTSAALATLGMALVAGCSPSANAPSGTATASSTPLASSSSSSSSPAGTPSAPSSTTTSASCGQRLASDLSPQELAGQLLMVGLNSGSPASSLTPTMRSYHVGGVILLGGWSGGKQTVAATTSAVAKNKTQGIGVFIAADQEGGNVQQLTGAGFSTIPSAVRQNSKGASWVRRNAATWAKELHGAGINVNLAPVADTVPASLGKRNAPIGQWSRQFSSDPRRNATMVTSFIEGMHAGKVASTIKHFPGLGRVTNNTDLSGSGVTDTVASRNDPYLESFAGGIAAGTDFVMLSSARYPKLDSKNQAMFSRAIVTGLLRDKLGYRGVTITDDVGAAKAVASVPVGERATRFVAAGGDVVLTAQAADVATMHRALVAAAKDDPAFAKKLRAAAVRVLDLKVTRGLAAC